MSNKIHKQGTGYAQVTNEILKDNELSLSAKGLYAFMYSKPEDWNFTIRSMASQLKEGQCAIKSALDELKASGWINYEKHFDGTGTYTMFTSPCDPTEEVEEPNVENPNVGFPNLGKSTRISNTNSSNKKDPITPIIPNGDMPTEKPKRKERKKNDAPWPEWYNDFSKWKEYVSQEFHKFYYESDGENQKWCDETYPNADLGTTLVEMLNNYWSTESGWENKKKAFKKSPTGNICWKTTIRRTFKNNIVWKQRSY